MEEDHRSTAECRYCRCGVEEGPLRFPCQCRGSISAVHQECLERWLNARGSNTCDLCGTEIVFRDQYEPGTPRILPPWKLAPPIFAALLKFLKLLVFRGLVLGVEWVLLLPASAYLLTQFMLASDAKEMSELLTWLVSLPTNIPMLVQAYLFGAAIVCFACVGFTWLVRLREVLFPPNPWDVGLDLDMDLDNALRQQVDGNNVAEVDQQPNALDDVNWAEINERANAGRPLGPDMVQNNRGHRVAVFFRDLRGSIWAFGLLVLTLVCLVWLPFLVGRVVGLRALEGVVSEEVVVPESFYPAFRTALAGTGPFRVSNLNATTPAHIERLLAAATLRELGYEVYIPHDPAATSMLSNLEFSEVIKLARLSEQPKEHGSNHSSNPITKYQANELWGITRGNPWSWRVNTGRASKNFVTQLGGFLEYFFSAAVSFVHKSVEGASALASRAVGSPAEGTNTTERTLWVLPRPSLTVKVRVDSPVVVVNSTHMIRFQQPVNNKLTFFLPPRLPVERVWDFHAKAVAISNSPARSFVAANALLETAKSVWGVEDLSSRMSGEFGEFVPLEPWVKDLLVLTKNEAILASSSSQQKQPKVVTKRHPDPWQRLPLLDRHISEEQIILHRAWEELSRHLTFLKKNFRRWVTLIAQAVFPEFSPELRLLQTKPQVVVPPNLEGMKGAAAAPGLPCQLTGLNTTYCYSEDELWWKSMEGTRCYASLSSANSPSAIGVKKSRKANAWATQWENAWRSQVFRGLAQHYPLHANSARPSKPNALNLTEAATAAHRHLHQEFNRKVDVMATTFGTKGTSLAQFWGSNATTPPQKDPASWPSPSPLKAPTWVPATLLPEILDGMFERPQTDLMRSTLHVEVLGWLPNKLLTIALGYIVTASIATTILVVTLLVANGYNLTLFAFNTVARTIVLLANLFWAALAFVVILLRSAALSVYALAASIVRGRSNSMEASPVTTPTASFASAPTPVTTTLPSVVGLQEGTEEEESSVASVPVAEVKAATLGNDESEDEKSQGAPPMDQGEEEAYNSETDRSAERATNDVAVAAAGINSEDYDAWRERHAQRPHARPGATQEAKEEAELVFAAPENDGKHFGGPASAGVPTVADWEDHASPFDPSASEEKTEASSSPPDEMEPWWDHQAQHAAPPTGFLTTMSNTIVGLYHSIAFLCWQVVSAFMYAIPLLLSGFHALRRLSGWVLRLLVLVVPFPLLLGLYLDLAVVSPLRMLLRSELTYAFDAVVLVPFTAQWRMGLSLYHLVTRAVVVHMRGVEAWERHWDMDRAILLNPGFLRFIWDIVVPVLTMFLSLVAPPLCFHWFAQVLGAPLVFRVASLRHGFWIWFLIRFTSSYLFAWIRNTHDRVRNELYRVDRVLVDHPSHTQTQT